MKGGRVREAQSISEEEWLKHSISEVWCKVVERTSAKQTEKIHFILALLNV